LKEGSDVAILALGTLAWNSVDAAEELIREKFPARLLICVLPSQ
jgi:hypothetical protein